MLEALREYRHLSERKRADGCLPAPMQQRLEELEQALRAARSSASLPAASPRTGAEPGPSRVHGDRSRVHGDRVAERRAPPGQEPARRARTGSVERGPEALPRSASRIVAEPGHQSARGSTRVAEREPSLVRPVEPNREWGRRSDDGKPPASVIDPALAHFERRLPDPVHRMWVLAGAMLLIALLAVALPLMLGLPLRRLALEVAPRSLVVGAFVWVVLYPAIFASWEYRSRRDSAHLSEPDFEVQLPLPEPYVLVLALLLGTLGVLTSGVATEGPAAAVGAVVSTALLIADVGAVAASLVRPLAARVARVRAYGQYVQGSDASLAKNNPRRARRLLERAMSIAVVPERRSDLAERLEKAVLAEAEQLRHRGLDDQADALLARFLAPRAEPAPAPEAKRTPPRLLPIEGLRVGSAPPPRDPALRVVHDRAAALAARGRAREAAESLAEFGLPVPRELAKEAAEAYVAQGLLRSAFLLYEQLGTEAIPEFYRAVAIEWARNLDDSAETGRLGDRILDALEARSAHEVAARVAGQVARDDRRNPESRAHFAARALALHEAVGEVAPPQVLEAAGQLDAAASAYEAAGRLDDAKRCLAGWADRMLASASRPKPLIPALSRLFRLDPQLSDEHLSPLVDHVVERHASTTLAQQILAAWRTRHPEDTRAAHRLFQLLVSAQRPDDALAELNRIVARSDSQPAAVVEDHRRLVESFPEHAGAREALARVLVRSGRASEAAEQLAVLADWGVEDRPLARRQALRELVKSLREWGPLDPELERLDGTLARTLDDEEGAIAGFERYVRAGGRDPHIIAEVTAALDARRVRPDGRPDYDGHARLAHFLLAAGDFQAALSVLDVLRAAPAHAEEALILAARVELLGPEPSRGLRRLAAALDGRRPSDAPRLFFEIAAAYAATGDSDRARRVEQMLEQAVPGFAAEYAPSRAVLDPAPPTSPLASGPPTGFFEDRTVDEGALGLQDALASPIEPPMVTTVEQGSLSEALAPRYRLIRRLGSGGMGEVHLAEDLALGREVAVKVLRRTLATDLFISKFRDEARIVAQLSHPGIVGVFDIGQQGAWSYIVMEYVRGPNLATLVSSSVPPPPAELISIIASVADAMAYAHRRGVVHRDLKPANILVGVDGAVKVTDFGIARVLAGEGSDQTAFSAAGLQVGTINYMAPEQLLQDHADARTDIYLLGTTLYFCLGRRYPFRGEGAAQEKTLREAPRLSTWLKTISAPLDDLLACALARDPARRPPSMESFARALRAVPDRGEDGPSEDLTGAATSP